MIKPVSITSSLLLVLFSTWVLQGCSESDESYSLVIEFPKPSSSYQAETQTIKAYSIISTTTEGTCEKLTAGIQKPDDDGYPIEHQLTLQNPSTGSSGSLRMNTDDKGTRLVFVQGENTDGDTILRGCSEVAPNSSERSVGVSLCPVGIDNVGLSPENTYCSEPPSDLSYLTNPADYIQGTAIATNVPNSIGGALTSYSVAPALPAGLNIDASTGLVTGTPTAITAMANYIVTGMNSWGVLTTSLRITIDGAPP
jgi:hypothetical protein